MMRGYATTFGSFLKVICDLKYVYFVYSTNIAGSHETC